VFLFSNFTYFMYLLYLGKLSIPKYLYKIKQNNEQFTERWYFDLSSLSAKTVWYTKDAEWISWQWLESWKHRQSAEESHKTGTIVRLYQAAVDRVRRVAAEDLVLSHVDKLKNTNQLVRFRMKLPFSVQVCTG